jgi:DNA-binding NarL/FixJ family response regulator
MVEGGRVLIADDHPLTREGLALAVRASYAGAAVDTAGSIAEASEALRTRKGYRLILLDFVLPDARGFSGFMTLQHQAGNVPIAMISAHEDPKLVEAARALGAAGFLYKTKPLDVLARELSAIGQGKTCFPPPAANSPAGVQSVREMIESLSDAQRKVLIALADGRLNKQIAADLGITEATVKAHLTTIFRKLGVVNRAQAMLVIQPLLGDLAAGFSQ